MAKPMAAISSSAWWTKPPAVHARGDDAERDGRVAVDHQLRLRRAHRRHAEAEFEVLLGPGMAGLEQRDVRTDHLLGLLAEDERDLVAGEVHVQAVEIAEHPQHEHVLALARVGDELAALVLHRHLVHPVAVRQEPVARLLVLGGDLRVGACGPHALEQDDAAGLELARVDAAEQHLLVEGDRERGLVAAVRDALRADADAVAARAGDAAGGRLDFGRDDFDRPHAVAHARGDRAQRLAAPLGAFAGVADDFHHVLGERGDGFPGRGGVRSRRAGRSVERHVVHHGSLTTLKVTPARAARGRSCVRGRECRTDRP